MKEIAFVFLGIIEIEEPRRIINVFLVLLGFLVAVGFAHGENGYTTRN